MPPKTHQSTHHDNSSLFCTATEDQVREIYAFCRNFGEYYEHFISTCYRIAPSAFLSDLSLIDNKSQFQQLLKEISQEGYVFVDTISDFTQSYKGQISWIMVGFNNRGYLIDAFVLHKEVEQMRYVIENSSIVKFVYRECILLEDAKRDWNAFGANFFDFQLFQKSIGVNKHLRIYPHHFAQRPISMELHQQMQDRYNNMIKYLAQIRYFIEKQPSQYPLYGYSNHYELLLKEYRHLIYSFEDEQKQYEYLCQQKKRKAREEKQNNYDSNSNASNNQLRKEFTLINERDRDLCRLFVNWRQHMARILDCPARDILNFEQIMALASGRPTSILEVQQLLSKDRLKSYELASKILQILAYESEELQNHLNQLQIKTNKRKEEKNFKLLLSQLKWQDREQWLNRRNDESIKLYKEIVSIVELDDSVVDEFAEGMNKPPVTRGEIHRFVKYAEYLRNGNHRRLKEYYDSCPLLQNSTEKDDILEGWESEDEETFIVNKHPSISLTSIAGSLQKLPQKMEPKTVSSLKGPHSCYSISEELESGLTHSKIEPLPQNIEQIYLKAVSVKKGYQKVQKKKGGRKQGKEDSDQFVPSWEQIKQLLEI